jgi:hypothetical protein
MNWNFSIFQSKNGRLPVETSFHIPNDMAKCRRKKKKPKENY